MIKQTNIIFICCFSLICNISISQEIVDDPTFSKNTAIVDPTGSIYYSLKQANKSQIILSGPIMRIDSLGNNTHSFNSGSFQTGSAFGLLETGDSKLIAYGSFSGYQGHGSPYMVKMSATGSVDNSFTSALEGQTGVTYFVESATEQQDGKVICSLKHLNVSSFIGSIQRLNSDGSIDMTFNSPYLNATYQKVANFIIQNDGKILVVFEGFIQRLYPDGSVDSSFSTGNIGSSGSNVYSDAKLLDDGTILFLSHGHLFHLFSDGTIDNSFISTNITSYYPKKIALGTGDKFYVFGKRLSGTNSSPLITRMNFDGSIDNSFNVGNGFNDEGPDRMEIKSMVCFDDGTISLSGAFDNLNNISASNLVKLDNSGSPIWMQKDGTACLGWPVTIHIDANKSIYIGGQFDSYNHSIRNNIVKLDSNGYTDFTFKTWPGFHGMVNDIITQPDGKVIVGGVFIGLNGGDTTCLLRFLQDGSIDHSFNPGGAGVYSSSGAGVTSLGIQSNGKIIVAGDFTGYNGVSTGRIVRLNANGSRDLSFLPGFGADERILNLIVKPNDEILICGEFLNYNGLNRKRIALLNSNGSLNNNFDPASAYALSDIRAMAIQSDGKIIVGGDFYSYTDHEERRLGRLNVDGTVDSSYVPNAEIYNYPESLCVLFDNNILVGSGILCIIDSNGSTITYESTSTAYDMHVNANGNPFVVGTLDLCPDAIKGGISRLALTGSTVGITENEIDNFTLYPNPTNDLITIQFEGNNAHYTIYDAQGKLIQTSTINSGGAVSLKDVQTGVYFFELKTEAGNIVKRVVKN